MNILNNLNKGLEEQLNEELLYEMATVRSTESFDIVLAVNPDPNRIGDPYFKMYDSNEYSKATKVARISFFEPKLISHSGEKKPWISLNSKDKRKLLSFLNSTAMLGDEYLVWDLLKYYWNVEKNLKVGALNKYLKGEFDTQENINNPNYVPSNLEIPDYMRL